MIGKFIRWWIFDRYPKERITKGCDLPMPMIWRWVVPGLVGEVSAASWWLNRDDKRWASLDYVHSDAMLVARPWLAKILNPIIVRSRQRPWIQDVIDEECAEAIRKRDGSEALILRSELREKWYANS